MPKLANKPIIAVDMDDVLFPMVDSLIEYVDSAHRVKMSRDEFERYDIREIWQGGPIEGAAIFEKYKNQSGPQIASLKGAQAALHKLSINYKVILVTSRDISVEAKTKEWLNHHFPDLFKDVHLLGNKKESLSYRPKGEVCKELGVSYLIDDSLKNIIDAHESDVKTILFGSFPWNQMDELPEGVVRVKDWQEVMEFFDGEAK